MQLKINGAILCEKTHWFPAPILNFIFKNQLIFFHKGRFKLITKSIFNNRNFDSVKAKIFSHFEQEEAFGVPSDYFALQFAANILCEGVGKVQAENK